MSINTPVVQPFAVLVQSMLTGESQRVDVVAVDLQTAVDWAMHDLSADWIYQCAEACDPDEPTMYEMQELTDDPDFDWGMQCMLSSGHPHYTENDCIF